MLDEFDFDFDLDLFDFAYQQTYGTQSDAVTISQANGQTGANGCNSFTSDTFTNALEVCDGSSVAVTINANDCKLSMISTGSLNDFSSVTSDHTSDESTHYSGQSPSSSSMVVPSDDDSYKYQDRLKSDDSVTRTSILSYSDNSDESSKFPLQATSSDSTTKSALFQLPWRIRGDIRNEYATMWVNMHNYNDGRLLREFFETFAVPECHLIAHYAQAGKMNAPRTRCAKSREEMIANILFDISFFPDVQFQLLSKKLQLQRKKSSKGSRGAAAGGTGAAVSSITLMVEMQGTAVCQVVQREDETETVSRMVACAPIPILSIMHVTFFVDELYRIYCVQCIAP